MATLPTVPSFTFEETPSIATLNQLAYCVTFLNTLPAYCELEGSPNVGSGSATALQWPTKVTDRDSGWTSGSNTRYTAQTPGYYDLSACIDFAANTTGGRIGYFQVTTGSGNPGGAGNTTIFGDKAVGPSNTAVTSITLATVSP